MDSRLTTSRKQKSSTKNENNMENSPSRYKTNITDEESSYYEKKSQTKKSIDISSKKEKESLSLFSIKEEMGPTNEELEFRKKKMKEPSVLEKCKKFYRCTKCNKNYQKVINNNQKISVHPFLGVLMCENCCDFYGDGNFSLDSDNEDKYCRWCGEGGSIFSCSKCIYGFCSTCIKKHFGAKHLKEIEDDDDWLCFFCNPKPLWYLRFVCSLAKTASQISKVSIKEGSTQKTTNIHGKRKQGTPKKADQKMLAAATTLKRRKVYILSDTEGSDQDDFMIWRKKKKLSSSHSNKKKSSSSSMAEMLAKLEKIIKLVEYQMSFGLNWSSKALIKLTKPKNMDTESDFVKECQKIKWFLSMMSSHFLEFCSAIESLEKNLPENRKNNKNNVQAAEENGCSDISSYNDILLFLGFVTNQVKLFMNEGISVQNLVEAEIINDERVLGIRKKKNFAQTEESTKNTSVVTLEEVSKYNRNETKCQTNTFNEAELGETNYTNENVRKSLEIDGPEAENEKRSAKLSGSPSALDVVKENLTLTNETRDKYEEILAILENS